MSAFTTYWNFKSPLCGCVAFRTASDCTELVELFIADENNQYIYACQEQSGGITNEPATLESYPFPCRLIAFNINVVGFDKIPIANSAPLSGAQSSTGSGNKKRLCTHIFSLSFQAIMDFFTSHHERRESPSGTVFNFRFGGVMPINAHRS
jgi:hypothetical protein